RRVDFAAGTGVQDMHRVPECAGRFLHISQLERGSREVRIYEHADRGSLGKQFVEQLQLLGYHSAVTPVTLSVGRLRLVTSPRFTGSSPVVNTIGIVVVAVLAASAEGLFAAITATFRSIRSATSA